MRLYITAKRERVSFQGEWSQVPKFTFSAEETNCLSALKAQQQKSGSFRQI